MKDFYYMEIETDIAVLKTNMQHLSKELGEIKSSLEKFINSADTKYAGKVEVDEMKDSQKWVWRTIIGTIIAGAVGLIFTR